ncbi:M23 family metallopeptidase [Parvularcula maris]|uniref:M23 family metallopeptidase n=1 Tax=Parvularcula maris TaxID=2965077 RepID=A0A9X2L6U3_9PROT|nr:M23 family metallopeptidase [Parvularcula maris]MCQ8184107.1 M23 family metallopeptidase [Parvularcula maris]
MLTWASIIQIVVVALILGGLFLLRSRSRGEAWIRVAAGWTVVLGLFVAGVWYYPPGFARWGIAVAMVFVSIVHLRKRRSATSSARAVSFAVPTLCSFAVGSVLLWQGVRGHSQPGGPVIDLASPMALSSNICVLSGGSSFALNQHFLTSAVPGGAFEKHSVDLVKHDRFGNRTRAFSPVPQPENVKTYLAYGEPVTAPCNGYVTAMANDRPDHPAGARFRDRSGSNYVMLRCEGADVVLAHLAQGSVSVRKGEEIAAGAPIGRIGHSGNTEEPHLHINAQTIVPEGEEADPEPVIMTFQGRYLARGDCL